MTPERKAWWDSLPKEEKRARRDIKELRTQITWHKIGLNLSCGHETEMRKFALRMNKRIIKALRKQIAMRPIMKRANGDDYRKCPHCGRYLWRIEDDIYYDYPPKYCEDCGQKLRWQ